MLNDFWDISPTIPSSELFGFTAVDGHAVGFEVANVVSAGDLSETAGRNLIVECP